MKAEASNYAIIAKDKISQSAVSRLTSRYPQRYQLAENVWLVRTTEFATQISAAVFPQVGDPHVVIKLTLSWGGRYDKTVWTWLDPSRTA